ncbi:hypothetical protein BN2476_600044 [Paraburkholderia piptadeniae]|uniref:Uncharacterized protein n=1 Tax=Paraburkholderia piptadeniae TaxID=1701573 RepID=A0A1N7SKD6_9BURK|nr:hypothetical protein BN2476_600044 [Paraburkholderia piptadeniae]
MSSLEESRWQIAKLTQSYMHLFKAWTEFGLTVLPIEARASSMTSTDTLSRQHPSRNACKSLIARGFAAMR